MWRKLAYLREGDWVPGRTNWLVLAVQVLLAMQSASRGMDYVQPRPPVPLPPSLSTIEAALPLPLWGTALLVSAGLVFAGLFGGHVWPIIVGHGALACLYAAFSYGLLAQTPIRDGWAAALGVLMLIPALILGVSRWHRWRWLRFLLAMALLVAGGWVTAYGLGYDFRTGTGLLVAALSHAAFSVSIAYVAYRKPPALVR